MSDRKTGIEDGDEDPLATAYNRGLAAEKAGDRDTAIAAYQQVLTLDPEDHGGAAIRLAALKAAPSPDACPPAYVATLFDQHAADFDRILVTELGYGVPWLVADWLAEHAPGPYARMLDLGCGTGLAAVALSGRFEHATGVDLAEGMVEIAHDRDLYDDLYVGDATGFLEAAAEEDEAPWDLILATDVLPYLGAVEALFAGVTQQLAPGGLFIFSTETMPDLPSGWAVGPKHRYAHDPDYLDAALKDAGLTRLAADPITVRTDDGAPVPGHLIIARR